MFEIIIKLKDDWIDLSGVSDIELCRVLSIWSNGQDDRVMINDMLFKVEDIEDIRVSR